MSLPPDFPANLPPEKIAGHLDQANFATVDSEGPPLGAHGSRRETVDQPPLSADATALLLQPSPTRHRLPERREVTRLKVVFKGHDYYVDFGHGSDGKVWEVFLSGPSDVTDVALMQDTAALVSLAMQYGVPTEAMMNVVGRQDAGGEAAGFASIIGEALAQAHKHDQRHPSLF